MPEQHPDRELTPAEAFESLVSDVVELQAAVIGLAVGSDVYARVQELRADRSVLHEIAPHILQEEVFTALLSLEAGQSREEVLQAAGTDPELEEVLKFEEGLEHVVKSVLDGMIVRQDLAGENYLTTARSYSYPRPGITITTFTRYRVHESEIVEENYAEVGNLPAFGRRLDEYRAEKIAAERLQGWNGMPVSAEQATELNIRLAELRQQLVLLKDSGAVNIRDYLS